MFGEPRRARLFFWMRQGDVVEAGTWIAGTRSREGKASSFGGLQRGAPAQPGGILQPTGALAGSAALPPPPPAFRATAGSWDSGQRDPRDEEPGRGT